MKKDNVIMIKSYAFALRIIKLYRYLAEEKKEFVLSKQLLRAGTSVGANIEEAIGAQTTKDFFLKLTVAYKEAREVNYWLRLLTDADYLTQKQSVSILEDSDEILRIIGSIQKSIRNGQNSAP